MLQLLQSYRDKEKVKTLVKLINALCNREYSFMEVCGGHTAAIRKWGIPSLLDAKIKLISGPGCPVCVTDNLFIDKAVFLSRQKTVIIASYGDLIRVPGSESCLAEQRSKGADVRIVYSILDAIKIAQQNTHKTIVFPAIGFETTAPNTAAGILKAQELKLDNFTILSAHKLMPPAMEAICMDGIQIQGFLCPGHVSTIIGTKPYHFLADKYNIACVISGFEPLDILYSILLLVRQISQNVVKVENAYSRAVKEGGNSKALQMMNRVFETTDENWRGVGEIKKSGLKLKQGFDIFNAEVRYSELPQKSSQHPQCICGQILKGLKLPNNCKLFAKTCTPENPVGACMVSPEGACSSYYKYN